MLNTSSDHFHSYDAQGRMVCCSLTDKVYAEADAAELLGTETASVHEHDHEQTHQHLVGNSWARWKQFIPALISFLMLFSGVISDHVIEEPFFAGTLRLVWYIMAYLPVAMPVLRDAVKALNKGEVFTEFTLMAIATFGAFVIGEYPEAVAVMLFYTIGELVQSLAVNRAKRNIRSLLDVRPVKATVLRGTHVMDVAPETVVINEVIRVKAGEKVAIDGILLDDYASFNAAALTGESNPRSVRKGDAVLAGMVNLEKVIEVKVTRPFSESSISKILDLVQHANTKKAKTELFIRRFSRVYTPVVVFLATALTFLPYFFVDGYVFSEWLYRALIFLVVSCPCALVVSIPLGYFGGIGAASRRGILFKGSSYLDLMTKVNTVVMDKTGTLTKGVFRVQEIKPVGISEKQFVSMIAALQSQSNHPIAKAIVERTNTPLAAVGHLEEIAGQGLKGDVEGKLVLAGNTKLLQRFNVSYPDEIERIADTVVVMAIDNLYAGYIIIADEIKEDATQTIEALHNLNIRTVMLSGDNQKVVDKVATTLKIRSAYGELLPWEKARKVEDLKQSPGNIVAFVGDGINDAPVIALSDVGIAMGGLGSDAAIETADVVIQTDHPSKIVTAIRIGKATRTIVLQNITLAFTVKIAVLALGAGGVATMWEAVFADVGVALLAILNATRIQYSKAIV